MRHLFLTVHRRDFRDVDLAGQFEIHLTVRPEHAQDGKLADVAARNRLKFAHIVLDRGSVASQPMFTGSGSGALSQQRELASKWAETLRAAGLDVIRVKIEAAPWNTGVPQTDADAKVASPDRYFEHHVKLLLGAEELTGLPALVEQHGARVSRNARRLRDDGRHERFVTQRCWLVGRSTARRQLAGLVDMLTNLGHVVLAVEEEYVVYDDNLAVDAGWIERWQEALPETYQPVPQQHGVRQRRTFDPALRQFAHAYRAGEPMFEDERVGLRWRSARRTAMDHILACVAASPWVEHLVLRGSVLLRAWLGDAAREPGDLDWVVTPPTLNLNHWRASELFKGLVAALRANFRASADVTINADGVAVEDIWTYERAPGRRLVIPWTATDTPPGNIQLDFVFNEQLPVPPVLMEFPGSGAASKTVVWAAGPELSLAWKILWLETDCYPQGKDLYDATLLAEHTSLPLDLLRSALARELGEQANLFTAESVLRWRVDWQNFQDEYPWIDGDLQEWQTRLARALSPTFR